MDVYIYVGGLFTNSRHLGPRRVWMVTLRCRFWFTFVDAADVLPGPFFLQPLHQKTQLLLPEFPLVVGCARLLKLLKNIWAWPPAAGPLL